MDGSAYIYNNSEGSATVRAAWHKMGLVRISSLSESGFIGFSGLLGV